MSLQTPPREAPRSSKGKGKGARRVSNLSEEQRNKKRENDRIAQQNIRRRNKELIESLQSEVETLRQLKQVQTGLALIRRVNFLEAELRDLMASHKATLMQAGRPYPSPVFDAARLPPGAGHAHNEFSSSVPHSFGSPFLPGAHPYDQWPSSVVPAPSVASVNSVESSPGASGPSEDFTPSYVHTSVPLTDASVISSSTSPQSLDAGKGDYGEVETVPGRGFPSHKPQHSSTGYIQEPPWSMYSTGAYYAQPTL